MSPLASTMIGVSLLPFQRRHHRLIKPPIVRASVKEGVLYMPFIKVSFSDKRNKDKTYQQRQQSLLEQGRSTTHSSLSACERCPRL
jgi:hypothetical protein